MLINRKIKRELLNGESILVANEKGLSYAMSFSFPKWKGYSLFSFIHQRRLSEVNSAKEKKNDGYAQRQARRYSSKEIGRRLPSQAIY